MYSGHDSLKTRRTLKINAQTFEYFSLKALEASGHPEVSRLPFSLRILLENLLRYEDGRTVTVDDIKAVANWPKRRRSSREIAFRPARVLMQDLTGVPAVVDLAAMREAMMKLGGSAKTINPLSPVDLVIDHSVMVDAFGTPRAFKENVALEYARNAERYAFLRWGATAFDNFRVVPPGTGICHQVNLEYLARVVWSAKQPGKKKGAGKTLLYPDTLVGTDSHTTMINGLSVLGWGVGGIEAEAAMLGQPISMVIPEVVGFRLEGQLKDGATATDLVLTITQMLRKKGVVGRFVEFFGPGLDSLPLADRATIANMAPEYGATCGFFPIDAETIRYLKLTGRPAALVSLVETYAKKQGIWRTARTPDPVFTDTLTLDLASVESSLAGPKRPQDRVALSAAANDFKQNLTTAFSRPATAKPTPVAGADYSLRDGDVMIAAITSCTNTSNPSVMIGAGLIARNANKLGLKSKPWVKTSLAPGSQVVTDYLVKSGLQKELDKLGFHLVGYGCTTCIGNSGPLPEALGEAIMKGDHVACSVLSGNRNFEGRISPLLRANYLASPMLVVAYALAGNMTIDLTKEPLGQDKKGRPVYLKDLWPSHAEITAAMEKTLTPKMFKERYANVFKGDKLWQKIPVHKAQLYSWDPTSTYVQNPPFFVNMALEPSVTADIKGARPLAILGDSITTDHISPAGSIKKDGPAGRYLLDHKVEFKDFNSYGARRGNHEVMMRGTFANIRLRNEMAGGVEGGVTRHMPDGTLMPIYDAAMRYHSENVPLVVIAGKEYGSGSSRDWAAKGSRLLGVAAVIAESFERIHRSNLIGMGVLPLQFPEGINRKTLKLDGSERFDITLPKGKLKPGAKVSIVLTRANGKQETLSLVTRIDTLDEVEYFRHGGILPYVLRSLRKQKQGSALLA